MYSYFGVVVLFWRGGTALPFQYDEENRIVFFFVQLISVNLYIFLLKHNVLSIN